MTQTPAQKQALRSRLLSLVFTDLVDSVGLKSRLGDAEAGRLIASHLEAVRNLLSKTGGREILAAGDGCFITFETPSEAVEFALSLQDHHRRNSSLPDVRIGIHMGEVTERHNTEGSPRPLDVEGLAVDIASRLQNLAVPRQILLSYPVFDNARQRLDSGLWSMPVEWRAHGLYIFQGTDISLEVYEVGLKSTAPFTPPNGGNKARRDVHDEEEATLGWRPAQGLPLPGRPNWVMVEKLGEGGFGDVWLVEHQKTSARHVVKFCYNADRLRALKREVTLFRILKEALGNRHDIARVLDFQFDTTPYFVEMEYAGEHTLSTWAQQQGGPLAIPLEVRLEIVAQVAEAIAAAHSTGVIHKDIKPSNIMISQQGDAMPQIKMIDFGIGAVQDRYILDNAGITATGFTEMDSGEDNGSSLTGTRLYMAPELIEGKPATTKSDIYSLGVLLYQSVSGKIGQALATGWERDIEDELIREDIACCVDGNPDKRLKSADELVWRIRNLPARRAEQRAARDRAAQEALRRQRNRRARIGAMFAAAAMLMTVMVFALYALMQSDKAELEALLRRRAEGARAQAETQEQQTQAALAKAQQARYFSAIALAEASLNQSRYEKAQEVLFDDPPENLLHREWGWLLAQSSPEDFALKHSNFYDAGFTPDGNEFIIGSNYRGGDGYLAYYSAVDASRSTITITNKRLVWNLSISPDGAHTATASSDQIVTIVDNPSRKVINQLRGHTGIIRDVSYSPDGSYLASVSRDKTLRVWSRPNYELVHSVSLDNDSPTELSFSPDSRFIATGSLEGNVRVIDVHSGLQTASLIGSNERVLSVTFTANGRAVAAASSDGNTLLFRWPPFAGEVEVYPYVKVQSEETYPTQVVSSPDGNHIYIGNDNGQILKIDAESGEEVLNFRVDQPLWKLNIDHKGKRLLTTTRWSTRMIDLERMEDLSTATAVRSPLNLPRDITNIQVSSVFRDRDSTWRGDREWRTTSGLTHVLTNRGKQFLVNSAHAIYSPDKLQHVRIDPNTFRWTAHETTSGQVLYENKRYLCVGATYSPDGSKLAVMYEKERTTVYNTSTWKPLFHIDAVNSPVSAMFTSDSRYLILGDIAGPVLQYDSVSGDVVTTFTTAGIGMPLSMDISNDDTLLAIGMDQDRARVFNIKTGDAISTMSGHVRYVHGVKFTPDGKRLSTLSRDGTVKLWDISTGRELVTLFSFKQGVIPLGIHFSQDGRTICVVTSDRRIQTADVFPWNLQAYGNIDLPLPERVERWKRKRRINPDQTYQTDISNETP